MVCSNSSETTVITLSRFTDNYEVVTVAGEAYCSIDSNNPVLVAQFASGGTADNTSSDPFMMNIPPIDQYSNKFAVVTPNEFYSNFITIFITPEYLQPDMIFVDGINQSNTNWTDIPCLNDTLICGHAANIFVNEGQHTVYHKRDTAKMSVSVYGFRLANGYGYYAVGDLKLDPFLDITMTSTGFNCSQSIFLKFNILFVGSGTHVAIVGGAITAILVVVAGILSVLLVSVLYIRRSRKINLVKNSIARYVFLCHALIYIMIANRPENIPNVQRDTTTTEKDNLYGQLFVYAIIFNCTNDHKR